jgi:hypothetical protein
MVAHTHTHVTHTTRHRYVDPDVDSTTRTDRTYADDYSYGSVVAARIVSYIAGVIEVILAFRFVLAMLGANRSNAFAQLVFNLSYPLVKPFFGLFGYTPSYGVSHLELYTLVAMAVYAILAWGIISLIRLPRHTDDEVE